MYRVRTLFWTKTSRTLQGLSRTHFAFFKDSIQCKKEIWVYVFFSSTTTWAILSWRSFILGTWESGLDKVSTEIQGLSSTDYNFQGLSRPWTFYFKFQGLSRTFKVRANPDCIARGHKKPITFFKTSRGRRPWCHDVSDLCCNNWFVARLNMDWGNCKVHL